MIEVSDVKGIEVFIDPADYPELFREEEVEQVNGGGEEGEENCV